MLMNILSVCTTVIVLSIYFTDPASELPPWLDKLVLRKTIKEVPKAIMVKEQKDPDMDSAENKGPGNPHFAGWKNDNTVVVNKWKKAAKLVNGFFFYAFLIMLIVMDVGCAILWSLG